MFRVPATVWLRRSLRSGAEVAFPFVVVALAWQLFAMYGPMPPQLFPGVDKIVATFVRLTLSGILALHALSTLLRLAAGFALGAVAGVLVGVLMGRSRWAEDLLVPLVSVGNPIPGLAYAPLFVIWFGLGDLPAILLVGFSTAFPVAVADAAAYCIDMKPRVFVGSNGVVRGGAGGGGACGRGAHRTGGVTPEVFTPV